MFKKIVLIVLLFLCGCAHYQTVEIAPIVDLSNYKSIGIIEFSSSGDRALGPYVTQEFMHRVQSLQPGARFVELGNTEQVLSSVGRNQIDLETIKLIGKKFNVDSLTTGVVEVSKVMVKPNFRFTSGVASLNAHADVGISLSAKLLETNNAATLWTNSRGGEFSLAHLGLSSQGATNMAISDPEAKYGRILAELLHELTYDFRPRYIKKRIE